jgi:hypothetical protein
MIGSGGTHGYGSMTLSPMAIGKPPKGLSSLTNVGVGINWVSS